MLKEIRKAQKIVAIFIAVGLAVFLTAGIYTPENPRGFIGIGLVAGLIITVSAAFVGAGMAYAMELREKELLDFKKLRKGNEDAFSYLDRTLEELEKEQLGGDMN